MAEYQFRLTDRRDVADGTTAFFFDTTGTNFTFEAGQNIDIFLPGAPESGATTEQMHTFSFASSPHHQDHFMITTRMRPSNYKNVLKTLPLGTPLRCVGPQGNMVLHEDTSIPAVFLAGGIGITPFRSMIEYATEKQLPHKIILFYGNRNKEATIFLEDLQSWAAQNKNLSLTLTIDASEPGWQYNAGHIDAAMLKKYLPDIHAPIYYIAGPPSMGTALRKMLIVDLGVSRDNVRIESFTGY